MVPQAPALMAALYESDETDWLERTAELVRAREFDRIDPESLAEYLIDMAKRERREVTSRLAVLMAHILKWHHQPGRRSGSWRVTIERERQELLEILESRVLQSHAEATLAKTYANAVKQAAAETGLPLEAFPPTCGDTLDEVLTRPIPEA